MHMLIVFLHSSFLLWLCRTQGKLLIGENCVKLAFGTADPSTLQTDQRGFQASASFYFCLWLWSGHLNQHTTKGQAAGYGPSELYP